MRKPSDSLRAALQMDSGIGGLRIGRERLTQQQINHYLLVRVIELEHEHFNMIGALQTAGLDMCDECEDWKQKSELIRCGDRCQCKRCFQWEYFIGENDSEETMNHILPELIRRLKGTDLMKCLPHDRDGKLQEPFLSEYRKITR